ncbi:hypothetical protein ACJRO7_029467 [Eucalyptus globulus]|uniref:stearoyl-[acyl-carrier-protein] 9-desaturase n=1 Tax=Eucalyptus globulus TaxID=34317 RepID=A0ABD3JJD4_EUCGL
MSIAFPYIKIHPEFAQNHLRGVSSSKRKRSNQEATHPVGKSIKEQMAVQLSTFLTSKPMKSPTFNLSSIANPSQRSPKSMSSNLGSGSTFKEARVQVTHSMPPEKIEIFKSMEDWAEKNVLVHLKPVENCWQPQDFLPDAATDGFEEQVRELRERAREIPDDYFVALVGSMITEEALPTYQTMLNTLDGVRDETGSSLTPWAIWTRAWTAEENKHGDLLNKYLYLSGRVDMKRIEKTIQYLIGAGMDPCTENSPYLCFIYTSFQERATSISHGNTGRLAKAHGEMKLAQIVVRLHQMRSVMKQPIQKSWKSSSRSIQMALSWHLLT